jgi:ribosomal-protein-alanine N-acetyltransferase
MPNINFTPFPNLTTERLNLRQLTIQDDDGMFALRADAKVAGYVNRPVAETVDQIRPFIHMINDGVTNNEAIFWALTLKNDNKLIGTICLWNIQEGESKAEIGYELLPAYHGKGLMQEAVLAVLDYGFQVMKLGTIEGVVHPENAPSIKLLERNKFARTGTLEDDGVEMVIYLLNKR